MSVSAQPRNGRPRASAFPSPVRFDEFGAGGPGVLEPQDADEIGRGPAPAVRLSPAAIRRFGTLEPSPDPPDEAIKAQLVAGDASGEPATEEDARRLGESIFDASPHGAKIVELSALVPEFRAESDDLRGRLPALIARRDAERPVRLLAGVTGSPGEWKTWNFWARHGLGLVAVSLAVLACLAALALEVSNIRWICNQSPFFDAIDAAERPWKTLVYAVSLTLPSFAALKAPLLFLGERRLRTYKIAQGAALLLCALLAAPTFAWKFGGGVDAADAPLIALGPTSDAGPSIPFPVWALLTILMSALTASLCADAALWLWRRLLPVTAERTTAHGAYRTQTRIQRGVTIEAVDIAAWLEAQLHRELQLRATYLDSVGQRFRTHAARYAATRARSNDRFLSGNTVAALLAVLLPLVAGCGGGGAEPVRSGPPIVGGGETAAEPTEWFVIVAPGAPRDTRLALADGLSDLALRQARGGDRICVLRAPELVPVASFKVPAGDGGRRRRDSHVKAAFARIGAFLLEEGTGASDQSGLPRIPAAIAASRRTEFRTRVVIAADPVHDDPQEGWSMAGGYVPQDGALDDETSPYSEPARLPDGTEVAWITPASEFGTSPGHRRAAERFLRLFVQEKGAGARLVRLSPDAATAFLFAAPQFADAVAKRDGGSGMSFAHSTGVLADDAPTRREVVVPVGPRETHRLVAPGDDQFDGVDEPVLRSIMGRGAVAEPVDLLVAIDWSGSMSHAKRVNTRTLEAIARALPPICPEVRIGCVPYAGPIGRTLPLAPLETIREDGGASLNRLGSFLRAATTPGGAADMRTALAFAVDKLAAPGRRQTLIVIGDTATESLVEGEDFAARRAAIRRLVEDWQAGDPGRRQFVAVYAGATAEDTPTSTFLRELCAGNPHAVYSNRPGELLGLTLDAVHR